MFEIQVKMLVPTNDPHRVLEAAWRSVCPTGGRPYTVATEAEGEEFARKWYPDCILGETIRVIASGDLNK